MDSPTRGGDIPSPIDVETLLRQVRIAFPVTTDFHPAVDAIGATRCSDSQELESLFRNRLWPEVPFDTLMYCATSWMFFSAPAYRYYLPAFIFAAFNPDDKVGILWDVEASLTPPPKWSDEESKQRWCGRMNGFSPSQRAVIVSFLEHSTWHALPELPSENGFYALEAFWYGYDGSLHE